MAQGLGLGLDTSGLGLDTSGLGLGLGLESLSLGKAKAKTLPPRSKPRGCCMCMLCSNSQCHMTVCHFMFRNV